MASALMSTAAAAGPMALDSRRPRPVDRIFPLLDAVTLVSKVKTFSPTLLNRRIRGTASPSLRPVIRAQSCPALLQMGIRGVTVSDVRGFGAQGGSTERHGGSEFAEDKLISKIKMEIVVSKDQVEAVIEKIIEEEITGEIGDGKIFLIPVSDVVRVRTGERGEMAERMSGGRADIISSSSN